MFRPLTHGLRNPSPFFLVRAPGTSSRRSFHATSPQLLQTDGGLIDGTMQVARFLFKSTHDSILLTPDWIVAIPLATLGLRLASYLLTDLYTARRKRSIAAARPFTTATSKAISRLPRQPKRQAVFESDGSFNPQQPALVALWKQHNDLKQYRHAVKLRYGARSFGITMVGLLQVPVWLTLAETLRSMCGTTYGLLGLIKISLGFSAKEVQNLHPDWIEPSMATEGFLNLLIPDATGTLSILLGGLTVLGGYQGLDAFRKSESWMANPILRNLVRIGPYFGLILIPMTLKFPAALLLFWTTSSLTALVRGLMLSKPKQNFKALTTGLENLGPPPRWLQVKQTIGTKVSKQKQS